MSEREAELCGLLVEEFLGLEAARLYRCLSSIGNSTLSYLIIRSGFPGKVVRHLLIDLIKHQLVLHHTGQYDYQATYQVNNAQTLRLARIGPMLEHVHIKFGQLAQEMAMTLHLHGIVNRPDLVESHSRNHDGHDQDEEKTRVQQKLDRMMEDKIVIPVRHDDMQSMSDTIHDTRRKLASAKFPDGPKGKEKGSLEFEVQDYVKSLQELTPNLALNLTKKRKRDEKPHKPPEKSKKLKRIYKPSFGDSSYPSAQSTDPQVTPPAAAVRTDMQPIRLNMQRIEVIMRTDQLANQCRSRFGEDMSALYRSILRVFEHGLHRCKLDLPPPDPTAEVDANPVPKNALSTLYIGQQLARNPYMHRFLSPSDPEPNGEVTIHPKARRKSNKLNPTRTHVPLHPLNTARNDDMEHAEFLSPAIKASLMTLHSHLETLSERIGNYSFISCAKYSRRGDATWYIDFPRLSIALLQSTMDEIIANRLEGPSIRLIKILQQKGKLDETSLSHLSFTRQPDCRALLSAMRVGGILQVQELARDKAMSAAKNMYLWFYDQEAARIRLLDEAYQAMSRILQRRNFERAKEKTLIDKSQRTDVVGNEEAYLTVDERMRLKKWTQREDILLKSMFEVDSVVAALRDF